MGKEFIIWGVAPKSEDEQILLCEKAGITNMNEAKRAIDILEKKYHCTQCRVQVIDFTKDISKDFICAINPSLR